MPERNAVVSLLGISSIFMHAELITLGILGQRRLPAPFTRELTNSGYPRTFDQ